MTEAEWLAATDPNAMLASLLVKGRPSERRSRLLASACCRTIWHALTDRRFRQSIEAAENCAAGLLPRKVLTAIRNQIKASQRDRLRAEVMSDAQSHGESEDSAEARATRWAAGWDATKGLLRAKGWDAATDVLRAVAAAVRLGRLRPSGPLSHTRLVRDIFGNPFRPAARLDPAWLAWNSSVVRKLAEDAYEQRSLPNGYLDNTRLALLGDALEDAGCTDAELLGHLRGPGPHVQGCLAVDQILGKS